MASSNTDNEWCTIESDPGVFTQLLWDLQCPHFELQELYSLDEEAVQQMNNDDVYGFIFLFEYGQDKKAATNSTNSNPPLPEEEIPKDLFFAHQVTPNACGTQALLSVVLNAPSTLSVGPVLQAFKEFTQDFPPALKGMAIGNQQDIQAAHNAFGRTDAFLHAGKVHSSASLKQAEVYHFVAYVPYQEQTSNTTIVYELDGLQSGPIVVGKTDENNNKDWKSLAAAAIRSRMQQAGQAAVQFNCMAVVKANQNDNSSHHYAWKVENQRRKHNFVPLSVKVLQELAKLGTLETHIQKAQDRKRQKKNSTSSSA